MALYLIGDIQGCDSPLEQLLSTIDFSPSRDTLYVLGDLVNRGPSSDKVLRRLMQYGAAAQCVLGNHDLHLLAVSQGIRKPGRSDTLQCILEADDCDSLLHWLRHQPLARWLETPAQNVLMVHAGVLPSWTAAQTLSLANEVQTTLRSPEWVTFLQAMYGNLPDAWSDTLQGSDRLRVVVNALTRMRFCSAAGVMEFASSEGADGAPAGFMPWFDVPGRQTAQIAVAFGHWSRLGWLGRTDVLCLDTGAVWGGALSALRFQGDGGVWTQELIQVPCVAAQQPG
jgi:bis(5'-nucleosyl)-tetraphosphatase (symmetrical)